jgi:hypothetical protein
MIEIKITVDLSDRAIEALRAIVGGKVETPEGVKVPAPQTMTVLPAAETKAETSVAEETKQRRTRKTKEDEKPPELALDNSEKAETGLGPVTMEIVQAKVLELVNAEKQKELKEILTTFKQRKIHELTAKQLPVFYAMICEIRLD